MMAKRPFSVKLPKHPDPLNTLGNLIYAKHLADGPMSPIPEAQAEQLKQKLDEAAEQHTLQKNLDRQKEKLVEARNLLLGIHPTQTTTTAGTVLFCLTSIRNFLLGQFRGAEHSLGEWGFTVNMPKGEVQVVIPRKSPGKLTKLAANVLKQHQADGEASILSVFDMVALKTLNEDATKKLAEAEATNRRKEKATQARNLALGSDKSQNTKTPGTVAYLVRSIRDILLGIYRGKEQQLGDWGYEVNFHTSPPPTPGS